jgi:diadenylate cyclase
MEIISNTIANFILLLADKAGVFWGNLILLNFSWQQIVLDILLVSIIFYFVFSLIKGSRAKHVLIGISIIGFIYLLSKTFQLVTLSWLLDRFMTIVLVAIPVVFQKELRMGLERLGHTKIFLNQKAHQIDRMIINIADACEKMAQEKIGALVVIQNETPLKEYIDTGIKLNAEVSEELLLSIFKPGAPLHDGAAIIADEKIQAASCILPHSFEMTGSSMGTRHKAAIGLSENTDANVIVISEEKGTISYAKDGKIEKNIKSLDLQLKLNQLLNPKRIKRSAKNKRKRKTW